MKEFLDPGLDCVFVIMWNAIKGDLLEFVNVIQTDVAQKLESNNDCSSNSNFASSEHVNKLGNVNSRDIEKLSNSRETFTEVST